MTPNIPNMEGVIIFQENIPLALTAITMQLNIKYSRSIVDSFDRRSKIVH